MNEGLVLTKGQRISLEKDGKKLEKVTIGLGWEQGCDLDALLVMRDSNGNMRNDKDVVYFGNLQSGCGSVKHSGDNLTGEGDGDDEQISVDLTKVPEDIKTLTVAIVVYSDGTFGQKDSYVRILEDTNEVMKYDLAEDYSTSEIVIACDIYRKDGEWKLKTIGEGQTVGKNGSKMLKELFSKYGYSA